MITFGHNLAAKLRQSLTWRTPGNSCPQDISDVRRSQAPNLCVHFPILRRIKSAAWNNRFGVLAL